MYSVSSGSFSIDLFRPIAKKDQIGNHYSAIRTAYEVPCPQQALPDTVGTPALSVSGLLIVASLYFSCSGPPWGPRGIQVVYPVIVTPTTTGALQTGDAKPDSEVSFYGRAHPSIRLPLPTEHPTMPGNSAYARAGVLVSQMTTEEKENVIHGWPGLCVGNTGALSLYFTGGPVGIRGQELVSPFRGHNPSPGQPGTRSSCIGTVGPRATSTTPRASTWTLGPVAGPVGRN
jgi:hypothetical protein